MDGDGAMYVQGQLFGVPAKRTPRLNRYATGRVTRDPAVAQATRRRTVTPTTSSSGMAMILASRPAEEREALRALLRRLRVA